MLHRLIFKYSACDAISWYSSLLGHHAESRYSRVLVITLYPYISHWIVIFKGSGSHAVPLYSSVLGCHIESWYSKVLRVTLYPDVQVFWGVTLYREIQVLWGVTLYREIPVFWDVTLYRESSLLGCHAGLWNWTQCVYWTVRTISFKQPKLSLVLKSMWDFWWTKWHWDESFSEDFGFPLSTTMLHTYIHLHAPVTRRAISKAWGRSKNNALLDIRKQWVKKHIHLVLKN